MKTISRVRWSIAIALWVCALGITLWNDAEVDRIATIRRKNDQKSMEYTFQRRHKEELLKIIALDRQQYLESESAALARVQLDSRIRTLAQIYHLDNLTFLNDTTRGSAEQISYRLNARGSLNKVLIFLTALHTEPYLSEKKTHLKITDNLGSCLLDTTFTVYLKIPQVSATDDSNRVGHNLVHQSDRVTSL